MDQGSTGKRSAVHNVAPTVTKFCVMWEGRALPHDTKFGNFRCEMVGRRVIFIWSLIRGSSWYGLIKAEPGNGTHWEATSSVTNLTCELTETTHYPQQLLVIPGCGIVSGMGRRLLIRRSSLARLLLDPSNGASCDPHHPSNINLPVPVTKGLNNELHLIYSVILSELCKIQTRRSGFKRWDAS